MNQRLTELRAALEDVTSAFLVEVESWPTTWRGVSPVGEWSSLQIIKHLLESENGILGYMTKKTSSGWEPIEPTGEEHDRNSLALNTRLISREQFSIPAILSQPDANGSLEELQQQWSALRIKFDFFIEQLDEEFYHRQIFNQPAAGKLNLYQTLEFMTNHILHHTYQLERLKDFHSSTHE